MKINRYIESFIKESKAYIRKPFPIFIALAAPIIGIIFLYFTFSSSTIKDIPIAVLNFDNSSTSRIITRHLDATQALNVVYQGPDRDYAESLFKNQSSYLTVIIPQGTEENIKRAQSAEITVVANGASLLYSKIGYRNIATTVGGLNAGITLKRLTAKGLTANEAFARALPARVEMATNGNPWYDYAIYVIPGLAFALLQMSASFSSLWLFRNHIESEEGRYIGEKGERIVLFIGKFLPIFFANVLALSIIYFIIFPIAEIPLNSAKLSFFFTSILFITASMGFGAALSIALRNLTTAAQVGLVVNAPAFVFAGYTFPRWAMPEFAQKIAEALPITHILDALFPAMIFDNISNIGIKPLIVICAILWIFVFILTTPLGDKIRQIEEKIASK